MPASQLIHTIPDGITPDEKQQQVLAHLDCMAKALLENPSKHLATKDINQEKEKRSRFFGFFNREETTLEPSHAVFIKGLYIWGDVGRGKTWLMDLFFASLQTTKLSQRIQRIHFHEFMLTVHKRLQNLPTQPDPLEIIGKDIAKQTDLICLDEFHVMDIADAVILHGLLKSLFDHGVTLITTSNRHPDDLYKNGSHRERFLPTIELIKQKTEVYHLDNHIDYRRQRAEKDGVFFIPHTDTVEKQLEYLFNHLADERIESPSINIYGRDIVVKKVSTSVIWFDFESLCRGMRASSDYLAIAKQYPTIFLSEIPLLHEGEEGPARRFLNLIDAFYDQHAYLILSSYIPIKDMYQGALLPFEFERALSRLQEMQSESWWADYSNTIPTQEDRMMKVNA